MKKKKKKFKIKKKKKKKKPFTKINNKNLKINILG